MSTIPFSQAAKLDCRITISRPIFDPCLAPVLDATNFPEELNLQVMRGVSAGGDDSPYVFNAEVILKDRPNLKHTEYSILGPDQNTIILSVFAPKIPNSDVLPVLYHIHGGGQVAGDRFCALDEAMGYLDGIESVIVSVEYRLSPETRAPGPAMDCYAGLVWTSENAVSLGIDPTKIIVYGVSGGGPLAAATCLIARDKKVPVLPVKGTLLLTPMLDDRCDSVSDKQFEHGTVWCGVTNRKAWEHVLGDDRGTDNVTPYQSPARATDLSNLPPTYIDAAECEVFRDPAVLFAMNMWRCGSTCELHVWPGGYHGFEMLGDKTLPLVKTARAAKINWLMRIFGIEATLPAVALMKS